VGRFLSVDPGVDTDQEDPQSWNQYAYVRNNPVGRRDPDGRAATDDKKKALQGASVHAGANAVHESNVRSKYASEVHKLDANDGAGRSALKSAARDQSASTGKALAEAKAPMSGEAARIAGTANKTNAAVDSAMQTAGKAGTALLVVGVGVSAYNIATAPEGQKLEAAVKEGGTWAGALAGGEAGAAVGALAGPAGAVVGGIGGAVVGAIAGSHAADTIYKAVTDQ
jgi:hypothetical protein